MDRFDAMNVFVRVVEAGSLSAAARAILMSLTSVSRHLSALEKQRLSMGRWELIGQRLLAAQGVSELEILGFSGVTSPFPKGYEANTERSDESTLSLTGRGARFDTVWAKPGSMLNFRSRPISAACGLQRHGNY